MEENKEPQQKEAGQQQKVPFRGMAVWFLLIALFLTLFQVFSQRQVKYEEIAWNPDFVQLVAQKRIRNCEIVRDLAGNNEYIRGQKIEGGHFRVNIIVTEYTQKWLDENGVSYQYKSQNPYLYQIVSSAIPLLLFIGLLYFFFIRQMKIAGRGAMSFGKSRARMLTRDRNLITFKDVAGIDEAEEEVQEIIEFLKDPKRFTKLGGRIPKGVMLVGAPGTGKTLLAKAIAGEAKVPFFSISGSDFVEMFVGVGASRVRDMFQQGKKHAPCIIFIDEIDAVGRSRFSGIGGGHDEREQTLNALLVEMDGFETQEGVIIIAATNRPDVLDNALLRPGRFDRQIVVDLPDQTGREAILKIHAKKVKLGATADLRRVARGTPGFSGADLANLINESALLAARRGAAAIERIDLEEARDKVRWGRERRSRKLDEKERRLTAYHEAGHAIVLALMEETEPLHKVTIIPRGMALGATMQLPEKDRYTQTRQSLLDLIAGTMGGRAAEEIVFNDITTGAQSDIKQSTHIARMMVCKWGMSDVLGPQNFDKSEELLFLGREVSRSQEYGEETARKIDEEVSRIIREGHERALQVLREHRAHLDTLAGILLERETVEGFEVEEILKHGRILDEAERAEIRSRENPTPPPPDAGAAAV